MASVPHVAVDGLLFVTFHIPKPPKPTDLTLPRLPSNFFLHPSVENGHGTLLAFFPPFLIIVSTHLFSITRRLFVIYLCRFHAESETPLLSLNVWPWTTGLVRKGFFTSSPDMVSSTFFLPWRPSMTCSPVGTNSVDCPFLHKPVEPSRS